MQQLQQQQPFSNVNLLLRMRKEIKFSLSVCSFVQMSIIPGLSNISHPIQIRLEEDFYLSS